MDIPCELSELKKQILEYLELAHKKIGKFYFLKIIN